MTVRCFARNTCWLLIQRLTSSNSPSLTSGMQPSISGKVEAMIPLYFPPASIKRVISTVYGSMVNSLHESLQGSEDDHFCEGIGPSYLESLDMRPEAHANGFNIVKKTRDIGFYNRLAYN